MFRKLYSPCIILLSLNFRDYLEGYGMVFVNSVSQEEWTKLRESVPYVELYR